jgi:hypothetical protein
MKRSTFAKAGMAAMAPSFVMVMVLAACLTIGSGSSSGGSSSGGGSDSGGVTMTAVSDSKLGGGDIKGIAWGGVSGQEKFVITNTSNGRTPYSVDGIILLKPDLPFLKQAYKAV